MKIVLVGHVCIDRNISENSTYTSWGSAVMYMAHYLQPTGAEVTLISSYGNDYTKYLKSFSAVPSGPDSTSTLVIENYIKSGRRRQRYSNFNNVSGVDVSKAAPLIADADIIVVAPLLPTYSAKYLRDLLSHRSKESLNILLPQGYFRQIDADGTVKPRKFREASKIISLFDAVIFSEEDCPSPEQEARVWASYSNAYIIMTQGERGASLVTKDNITKVKTAPVDPEKVVDSIGCGDVFSAAFAHDYFLNKQAIRAIKEGNRAAANRLLKPNPALK